MAIIRDPLRGRTLPPPSHTDEVIIAALNDLGPRNLAVLTGAGISTDSGIPDYRGPDSPPRNPMTIQVFLSHPRQRRRYWARSWIGYRRMTGAQPNAGHLGLARLGVGAIVTQNVDGLHESAAEAAAGEVLLAGECASGAVQKRAPTGAAPTPIIDLHGRIDRVICLRCGELFSRDWLQGELTVANPDFLRTLAVEFALDPAEIETAPDGDAELEYTDAFHVVDCPICGGVLKPDVVYFGENVPVARVAQATELVEQAQGLVVLGSSLAVMSGLRFVRMAKKAGKPVFIVTAGPTRADELADFRSVSRTSEFISGWLANCWAAG